jgi:hypothetical protein
MQRGGFWSWKWQYWLAMLLKEQRVELLVDYSLQYSQYWKIQPTSRNPIMEFSSNLTVWQGIPVLHFSFRIWRWWIWKWWDYMFYKKS